VRADNENDETFGVILVMEGEHVNSSTFMDDFKNSFVLGELLIQGYCYEQYQLIVELIY